MKCPRSPSLDIDLFEWRRGTTIDHLEAGEAEHFACQPERVPGTDAARQWRAGDHGAEHAHASTAAS